MCWINKRKKFDWCNQCNGSGDGNYQILACFFLKLKTRSVTKIIKKISPKGLRSLIKLDSLSWIISKIMIENIGAKSELPDWENQIDIRKLNVREKLNDFRNLE